MSSGLRCAHIYFAFSIVMFEVDISEDSSDSIELSRIDVFKVDVSTFEKPAFDDLFLMAFKLLDLFDAGPILELIVTLCCPLFAYVCVI